MRKKSRTAQGVNRIIRTPKDMLSREQTNLMSLAETKFYPPLISRTEVKIDICFLTSHHVLINNHLHSIQLHFHPSEVTPSSQINRRWLNITFIAYSLSLSSATRTRNSISGFDMRSRHLLCLRQSKRVHNRSLEQLRQFIMNHVFLSSLVQ